MNTTYPTMAMNAKNALNRRNPETLIHALKSVANRHATGFYHQTEEDQKPCFISHHQLNMRTARIGAGLQNLGMRKGDRIGLILSDSVSFIESIFGSMLVGLIPVPVYPPFNLGQLDTYIRTTSHIFNQAECRMVLTESRIKPLLGALMSRIPNLEAIQNHDQLLNAEIKDSMPDPVDIRPNDTAFLQFTSGSTSKPKGVILTHANLIANVQALGGLHGIHVQRSDSAVSWLPLYHDMGLIGFVFGSIYYDIKEVLFLSPLLFLKRPSIWLRLISERGATISFAPNFAYGLCASRIKDNEIEGLDLSRLRVAGCGAEPIQYETLKKFEKRFTPHGFRAEAFLPCYGMAEHSLAITFVGIQDTLEVDEVDAEELALGIAKPVYDSKSKNNPSNNVVRIVNCGRPFPYHEIKIIDHNKKVISERQVGEICIKGPSIMKGYYNDPEKTKEVFINGWLFTGDLGYIAEGNLYVCGRKKDLIIVKGRNYYPQDIEWSAAQLPCVRKGGVAAFSISASDMNREKVVVAAEVRGGKKETNGEIIKKIRSRIMTDLYLKVDEVLLLPPGGLHKTSSGKIKRYKARNLYLSDGLGQISRNRFWNLIRHLILSCMGYATSYMRKRQLFCK